MAFIGILTDPKNETYTRNTLNKYFSSQHDQVLFINNKTINNIKNIRFETILFDTEDFIDEDIFIKILTNCKTLIMNSDIPNIFNSLNKLNLQVITFGFKQKSTVTISSVTDEDILMCIQRSIRDISGKIIDPQEIKINIKKVRNIMPISVIGIQILRFIYNRFEKI